MLQMVKTVEKAQQGEVSIVLGPVFRGSWGAPSLPGWPYA